MTSREDLEELQRRIADGRVIVVVGAGVSRATVSADKSEALGWRGFLLKAVDDIADLGLAGDDPTAYKTTMTAVANLPGGLTTVASDVESRLRAADRFPRWLVDFFEPLKATHLELIQAIAALECPIATTNYDRLIELVTGYRERTWKDHKEVARALAGETKDIVHLHGYYDNADSVILGLQSYERVIGSEAAQAIQKALGMMKTLLFIGCGDGVRDPNIGAFLEWYNRTFPSERTDRHYLLELNSYVPTTAKNLSRFNVRVLGYGDKHEDLTKFIRRFARFAPTGLRRAVEEHYRPEVLAQLEPKHRAALELMQAGRFVEGERALRAVLDEAEQRVKADPSSDELRGRAARIRVNLAVAVFAQQDFVRAHEVTSTITDDVLECLNADDRSSVARLWYALEEPERGAAIASDLPPQAKAFVDSYLALKDSTLSNDFRSDWNSAGTEIDRLFRAGNIAEAGRLSLDTLDNIGDKAGYTITLIQALHAAFIWLEDSVTVPRANQALLARDERPAVLQRLDSLFRQLLALDMGPFLNNAVRYQHARYIELTGTPSERERVLADLKREQTHPAHIDEADVTALEQAHDLLVAGQEAEANARMPASVQPWRRDWLRALMSRGDRRLDDAVAALNVLYQQHPCNVIVARDLAETLAMQRRNEEAIAPAQAAVRELPCRGTRFVLATVLAHAGRPADGYAVLAEVEDLSPELRNVRSRLALTSGHFAQTRDDLAEYLKTAPHDVDARLVYAQALSALGNQEAGANEAWRALEDDIKDTLPFEAVAVIRRLVALLQPLSETAKQRLNQLAHELKRRFANDGRAEQFRLSLLAQLGDHTGHDALNYGLMEAAGIAVRGFGIEALREYLQHDADRVQNTLDLYRVGLLSFETVAKETNSNAFKLITELLEPDVHHPTELATPVRPMLFSGHVYGAQLLMGELEVALMSRLKLFPLIDTALGPDGRIVIFEDVWHDLNARRMRLPSETFQGERESWERLFQRLQSDQRVRFAEPGFAETDDEETKREQDELVRRVASSPASVAWSELKSLPLRYPSLFRLKDGDQLDVFLKALRPEVKIVVPSDAYTHIRQRIRESIRREKAAKAAIETWNTLVELRERERVVVERRPDVPSELMDFPPENSHIAEDLAKVWSYREAQRSDAGPPRLLLTADFAIASWFAESTPLIAFESLNWGRESALAAWTRYRDLFKYQLTPAHLTEQVLAPAGLLDQTRVNEVLADLARLGFGDAIGPDYVVAIGQQNRGNMETLPADADLRALEHYARWVNHPGQQFTVLRIAEVYARSLWRGVAEDKLSPELQPAFVSTLLRRVEALDGPAPGILDHCLRLIVAETRGRVSAAFVSGSKDVGAGSPSDRLWHAIGEWSRATSTRVRIVGRAIAYGFALEIPEDERLVTTLGLHVAVVALGEPYQRFGRFNPASFASLVMSALGPTPDVLRMSGVVLGTDDGATKESRSLDFSQVMDTAVARIEDPAYDEGVDVSVEDGRIQVPIEAALLRASKDTIARLGPKIAGYWSSLDGRVEQRLRELATAPDDRSVRMRAARSLILSPAGWLRADPSYVLTWIGRRPDSHDQYPHHINSLRELLGEIEPFPAGDIVSVFAELLHGYDYDRFVNAARVPLNLVWMMPFLDVPNVGRRQRHLVEALGVVHHRQWYLAVDLTRALVMLRFEAARAPFEVIDGKEVDLRTVARDALEACIEDCLAPPTEQNSAGVELAHAEVALYRLAARVIHTFALQTRDERDPHRPVPLDPREALFLVHRLACWLADTINQASTVARREGVQRIIEASDRHRAGGPSVDVLNPFQWSLPANPHDDAGTYPIRLASILFANVMADPWANMVGGDEAQIPRPLPTFLSPQVEKRLVELASRPLTPFEYELRRRGKDASVLGVSAPAAIPDLALFLLLRQGPAMFRQLSNDARLRWLDALVDPDTTLDLALRVLLLDAFATSTERWSDLELGYARRLLADQDDIEVGQRSEASVILALALAEAGEPLRGWMLPELVDSVARHAASDEPIDAKNTRWERLAELLGRFYMLEAARGADALQDAVARLTAVAADPVQVLTPLGRIAFKGRRDLVPAVRQVVAAYSHHADDLRYTSLVRYVGPIAAPPDAPTRETP